MSTVANVVLPKEKKVRVKKADVPAPAPAPAVESPKKVATPKKESTPKPQEESEAEKKPRKPTLSAKYTKFVVFGYSMVNALVAAGLIPEDQVDVAYAQIKLMDSVEDQTAFYSNFLENLSASGKAMKKFVNDKKKPPKEPKVRKPRAKKADSDAEPKAPKEKKPRAKKEAKSESESEPKEKKPRAKKSVTVESDANVDLISNLVNAAQADPIPAPVEAPAEAPKAKKESKAKEPKAKEPKAKAKKETPAAPVVEPTPALEAEDDDDEVIQTRETVIDGETFLVDQEGNLYDPETHEFVRKL